MRSVQAAVPRLLADANAAPDDVVGIGIDFTSCTMLPTLADGTPLCTVDGLQREPHAWVKLWKHHAAQPEADRINAVAAERTEAWLPRYGGRISAEWFFAKALQILDEAPEVYARADRLIEACDWIVWQLTGVESRSACAAVPASEIATLFEGIAELGILPRCDAVLSGYLGDAGAGPVLLDIVGRVKEANPRALFACDPVMGDVGPGWYVRAGVPEFYRDHAIAAADIVTPNRFELEWLTGRSVTTVAEAGAAAAGLRQQGPSVVLVTSLDLADDRIAVVAAGSDSVWAVDTPRLPIEATGCGDAVAALFLGWLLRGKPLPEALAATIAAIYGVIEATMRNDSGELALVAAQNELVAPTRSVSLQQL